MSQIETYLKDIQERLHQAIESIKTAMEQPALLGSTRHINKTYNGITWI